MAPLEKEASHREKILTDASVRLALIKEGSSRQEANLQP